MTITAATLVTIILAAGGALATIWFIVRESIGAPSKWRRTK